MRRLAPVCVGCAARCQWLTHKLASRCLYRSLRTFDTVGFGGSNRRVRAQSGAGHRVVAAQHAGAAE